MQGQISEHEIELANEHGEMIDAFLSKIDVGGFGKNIVIWLCQQAFIHGHTHGYEDGFKDGSNNSK